MKLKTLLLVFIIFLQSGIYAQVSTIDSLKKVVQNAPKDSNIVNNYLELAKIYSQLNADTAFVYCNLALKVGQKADFYKGVANSYRQIGILYYLKGENDKAIQNFTLSLKTWQEAGDSWGEARAYNNIGIIYKNLGQYDKALESYIKSSAIQKSIKDIDGLARSNNNIANIYLEQANFGQALEYSFLSLKSHEELGNEPEIASTYNNIGNIYKVQEDFKKAIDYYEKALVISKKIGDKKSMADIYNNYGDIYKEKGRSGLDSVNKKQIDKYYITAIEYYQKSLPLYSEIGFKKGIALTNNSIGDINLKRGKFDNVIEFFDKSLKAYKEMGDKNGITYSYISYGNYYHEIKKFDEALKYYKQAFEITKELNSPPELVSEIAENMSKSYVATGQYQKAYESHKLFSEMEKRIRNKETAGNLNKQEINYAVNKKQKEMELEQQKKDLKAEEEIRTQAMYTKGAFLGLALMALLAFFIYRGYRIKQKSNILLAAQKEEILQKNEELKQLNEEITAQRELVEIQRDIAVLKEKEITDSIQYAKRIQTAVLPHRNIFVNLIPDYFIYFKPRDIVSGDFYWMKKLDKYLVIAAADCTGHGVPGAFMSMLGISFLNEIVTDHVVDPGDILNRLSLRIIDALHQTWRDDEAKDGMDIALTVINMETKELKFAGAYNPLLMIRNNELTEIKGNKMPIGIHIKDAEPFTNHSIQLQEKDTIYLFSDGYLDQFGGTSGGKFKSKQFKELLLSINNESMYIQKELIDSNFENWKGDLKQLDDILIIGMRF